MSSSRQAQVDEDNDSNVINIEDYDGADDESIEDEEDNSDYLSKHESVMP
jgi:hypothetical protein